MTKSETGFALVFFHWRARFRDLFCHSSFVIRISILTGLALTTGCLTVRVPEPKQQSEIVALTEKLSGLSAQVNSAEAQRVAVAAVRYPLQLAREWRATPPAVINNVLINSGIHSRGLCYQWADSLTAKLLTLHLQTLEIHRGVAHLGTKHEHSSVVLTAPGQAFDEGIALDAWRHCGRLNFSPVRTDNYPWKEVELIPSYQEELRAMAAKLEPIAVPDKLIYDPAKR